MWHLSEGVGEGRVQPCSPLAVKDGPFHRHHRLHRRRQLDAEEEDRGIHRAHGVENVLLRIPKRQYMLQCNEQGRMQEKINFDCGCIL